MNTGLKRTRSLIALERFCPCSFWPAAARMHSGDRAKADPPARCGPAEAGRPGGATGRPHFPPSPWWRSRCASAPSLGNNTAATVAPLTQSAVASQVAGVVARVVHLRGLGEGGAPVVLLDALSSPRGFQHPGVPGEREDQLPGRSGQRKPGQSEARLPGAVRPVALQSAQKNYDSQKALADIGGAPHQPSTPHAASWSRHSQLEAARSALVQNKKSDTQSLAQLKLAIDMARTSCR